MKSEFLYYVWDKHPELITDEGKILASADIDGLLEKFNKLPYDKKRVYTNTLDAGEERKKIFEDFVERTAANTVDKGREYGRILQRTAKSADAPAEGDAQDAKDTLSSRDGKTRNEGKPLHMGSRESRSEP